MKSLLVLMSLFIQYPFFSVAFVPGNKASFPSNAMSSTTSTGTSSSLKSESTSDERLIPREILFGNPEKTSPKLSPDGKYLAFLAPSQDLNVLNVFVRELSDPSTDRQVTDDRSRGIRQVLWAEDSQTILYLQDHEGDENFHLYMCDVTDPNSKARDLTPGENVKASSVMTNKRYPNEIKVGTNQRDSKVFDMYRCNYKDPDSKLVLDTENPGDVVGWGAEDESFEIREAVVRNQADSSTTVRVRDSANDEWRDLLHFPYGEEGGLVEFGTDGTCYVLSTLGRDTKALLQVDLETGETINELYSDEKCDVGRIFLDDDTKKLRMVATNYARTERIFFDEELEKDYKVLKEQGPTDAEVGIASRTKDEKLWVVVYSRSDGPSEYRLYDQVEKKTTPLFVTKPDLLEYKLAPMEDIHFTARDGLDIVGYLTRATTEGPSPLILLVHGGPWARDFWGFNANAQWFANRGYSTLQINFRGSTGYGKTHLHKGDKEWGVGTMQHDLTDAVQWAIQEGIADPEKVCIYGGSYGGYACLAGLTFTPDLYCCGVDIVGPSNVKTLLDSIPPYWGPLRNQMLLKIGDVDTDSEFNEKISPLFHTDKIKAPLLIGQGANDPRVKQAEADQIAFNMQKKDIPVEYVLYPDEGHGFARPANRIDFNGRSENFLAKYLGGRAEPFVTPEGSTAKFPLLEKETQTV
mmetsp:Transcript_53638/g.130657  ORF Transcript_53638/g.130657 Transcript_53638/m.130657 type:complete len:692 (+) Transcript_53638:175-2250(+)